MKPANKLSALTGLCMALACSLALASPLGDLAKADPAARADLIETWAATATPERDQAVAVLEDGRLLANDDGSLVLVQDGDHYKNAETGAAVPTLPQGVDAVPVNNRLRVALDTYHAAAGLHAADPAQRVAAVQAMQEAGKEELLPLLDARFKVEKDDAVLKALNKARAMLRLSGHDTAARVVAINDLAGSADPAVITLMTPFSQDEANPPEVRKAATAAIAAVQHRVMWYSLLGNLFSGLSLGSVLLLAALGLAITYGLLGVINMAHGEMLMLGAYTTYVVQNLFRSHAPGAFDYYLLAALPAAFVVTALVGMLLERLVIRHLYGRPLETLLATWGISLMLIQLVRVLFGAQNVEVTNPSWLSGGWQLTPVLTLPYNRIVILGFVLGVLVLTWTVLNKTRLGLFVRAVTQNRRMADSVGVPTGRIDMLAFGLGSGIAGLGGVALSQIGNVGPDLGQGYIVDSFMVVVLGGVGQLAGTVFSATGLGVLNKILEPSMGAVLGKILILGLIILFIQKRPQGLFALKGRVID